MPVGRLERLRTFVERDSFICQLGSSASKNKAVTYCELPAATAPEKPLPQLLQKFFKGESAALVIAPAKEPDTFADMKLAMEALVGDVLLQAVFYKRNFAQEVSSIVSQLPHLIEDHAPCKIQRTNNQYGIGRKEFLRFYMGALALKACTGEDLSKLNVPQSLREFSRNLVANIPCMMPMVEGRGALVIVAMSPHYHADFAYPDNKPSILSDFSIPHARYSPITCLAISWLDDVNKARTGPRDGGSAWTTLRNVVAATLVYNSFAKPGYQCEPTMIINPPYRITEDPALVNKAIQPRFGSMPDFAEGLPSLIDELFADKLDRARAKLTAIKKTQER
jgi:hypothetical protein